MTSAHILTLASGLQVPIIQPNTTVDGEGFFISHNDHDISIYGCQTTALVVGRMQAFYILNGDHREAYTKLIPLGLDACISYFNDNLAQINKRSERPQ